MAGASNNAVSAGGESEAHAKIDEFKRASIAERVQADLTLPAGARPQP